MSRSGPSLGERVRKLQRRLVRDLNNQHIFIGQALPVLRKARSEHAKSTDAEDRKYFVPSQSRPGIARRNSAELKKIYDAFLGRELFATSLIAGVAMCEAFIFDVLRTTLREYPQKLSVTAKGAQVDPAVPLSAVVNASDLAEIIEAMIKRRLYSASYASPRDYLAYFNSVTGIAVTDAAFDHYVEIKATRDVLVHNAGLVNDIYVEKAGLLKRGKPGKAIPMSQVYYDESIACLKRVANLVAEGAWDVFGRRRVL